MRRQPSITVLGSLILFLGLNSKCPEAKQLGAKILEGYPVEPKKNPMPDVFAFYGLASAFKKAGFKECLRRSETRPIMRYFLNS